jgi:hypothetical protein
MRIIIIIITIRASDPRLYQRRPAALLCSTNERLIF